jgi:hypothetical protein
VQANKSVATRVVFLKAGPNSSLKAGRSAPFLDFFFSHNGDSGRKGRMKRRGIAGIKPESKV